MRKLLFCLFPALLLLVAGCDDNGKSGDTTASSDGIATVNGEAVSKEQLSAYAERRAGKPVDELDPAMRAQLLDELINIELLAQSARADNLQETAPLKQQLAFQRETAMADAAMTKYLEQHPVTDEEVAAEYEKRKGELSGTEYKARHILVDSEEKAKELIAKLDKGGDFTELAKKNSTEPGADQSGGDLGWFSGKQMVPPFSAAVASMQPGEHSKQPVQTQFGWHVILLEDTRESAAPPLDQVAPQVQRYLTNLRVQQYIEELRAKANIEKPETEMPAADEMPQDAAPEGATDNEGESDEAAEETPAE